MMYRIKLIEDLNEQQITFLEKQFKGKYNTHTTYLKWKDNVMHDAETYVDIFVLDGEKEMVFDYILRFGGEIKFSRKTTIKN